MKMLLVSAVVVSLAMVLTFSTPIAVAGFNPTILSDLLSPWLIKPPYLYILINAIIVAIDVSSASVELRSLADQAGDATQEIISQEVQPEIRRPNWTNLEGPSTSVLKHCTTANSLHSSIFATTTKSVPLFVTNSRKILGSTSNSQGMSTGFASAINTASASWSSLFSMPPSATKSASLLDMKSRTSFGSTLNYQGFSTCNASGFSSPSGFASISDTASTSWSSIFSVPPGFDHGPSVSSQDFKLGSAGKILKTKRATKFG